MMRSIPLLALLLGCGAAPTPSPIGPWQTSAGADHPLVGRIWSSADQAFVPPAAIRDAARKAHFVLLGEQHDHPDHHRLQAWLLRGMLTTPRPVAFEMLRDSQAEAVARARDAAMFAEASGWSKSGWPEFALYAPVFEAVYAAGARVVVAHPERALLRAVMTEGLAALPADHGAKGLERPLPEALAADLADQIRESHCGHAPERLVQPMATAQRVKDAWMAWRLAELGEPAVLVTGNGHVRRDRGVPLYLREHGPGAIVAIGLIPVDDDGRAPADYHPERFDFLYFTPRLTDEDPCLRFQEQLERIKSQGGR